MDEAASRLGAHRDPAAPLPALIAGQTVHSVGEDGEWRREARSGKLILLDGLFDLEVHPYHCIEKI